MGKAREDLAPKDTNILTRDVSLDELNSIVLNDISNVNTTPSDGDALIYDSATETWIADTAGTTINSIGDIADVTITTPSDGDALIWDATEEKWISGVPDVAKYQNVSKTIVSIDSQTDFDISDIWVTDAFIAVYRNGLYQILNVDYTIDDTIDSELIILINAAEANENIVIIVNTDITAISTIDGGTP